MQFILRWMKNQIHRIFHYSQRKKHSLFDGLQYYLKCANFTTV